MQRSMSPRQQRWPLALWAMAAVLIPAFLSSCGSSGSPTQNTPVPTQLAFLTQPTGVQAGVVMAPALQVEVRDASGAKVTSASNAVTLALGTNPSGATLSGTLTVSAQGGVATFTDLTLDKVGTGFTIQGASGSLTVAATPGFDVAPGPPATLAVTAEPSNIGAGHLVTPGVAAVIRDRVGNLVTASSAPVTVALGANPGGATLTGTLTVAAIAGVATFNDLSLTKADTGYTLKFTSPTLTNVTSSAFRVTAAAPTRLVFLAQPTNAVARGAIAPAIQVAVRDSFGNLDDTATDPITVAIGANPSGGALGGTATVAAVSGFAQFTNLTVDRLGVGYTLVAHSGTLANDTSASFNITGRLVFTGQPGTAEAGDTITGVQVSVEDALGATLTSATPSVSLSLGNNAAKATLTGTLSVSAVAGVADFGNLALNKSGPAYVLVATSSVSPADTSASFHSTLSLTSVTAGLDFSCGLSTKGRVACWGADGVGQLGNGVADTGQTTSTPVLVPLRFPAVAVVGNLDHVCADSGGGSLYCWGSNFHDQLGLGSSSLTVDTAARVQGGASLSKVASGDGDHTCALASASAYCWGNNTSGALGSDSTGGDGLQPAAVYDGHQFSTLTIGRNHTCGLTTTGAAYCWGSNGFGEVGNDSLSSAVNRPDSVHLATGLTALSAGGFTTCALATAGQPYCWGSDSRGVAGNDSTSVFDSLPTLVQGGFTFSSISVNEVHACAIAAGGTLYCWGAVDGGQLGNGSTTVSNQTTPAAVLGGLTWQSVASGGAHTCGITTGGVTYCWGDDTYGQVGDGTRGTARATPVKIVQ